MITWWRCFGLVVIMAVLATVIACGGSEDGGIGTRPVAGITVVGQGQASAKPDAVTIRLFIGSEGQFGLRGPVPVPPPPSPDSEAVVPEFEPMRPEFEFITREDLEPVLQALRVRGVADQDIVVSPLGENFGPSPSTEVVFPWPRPSDVAQALEVVQEALREESRLSLQRVSTIFTVNDCEALESQAREKALLDAKALAEDIARKAGVQLGSIVTIVEFPAVPFSFLVMLPGGSCAELESGSQAFFTGAPSATVNSPSVVEVSTNLQVTYGLVN